MRNLPPLAVVWSCLLVTGSPAQDDPALKQSEVEVAGGRVAVRYEPMPLPGRSLERHQAKGTVWSIGRREAAVLETDVALVAGGILIPPGIHRMSTWYRDRGDWQLLVFAGDGPKNYRSGTPYKGFKLQLRELEKPRAEVLQIDLEDRSGAVRLDIHGGTTRLRLTLDPLQVIRHRATLAGEPAVYEFYSYPADARVQGRLRDLELVQFGRVRTEGEFGAVYDISCKSDGNGIFVICHSTSLQRNRDRLASLVAAQRAAPGDTALAARVTALQEAIRLQTGLQSNVMVPGAVEKVKTRARQLAVEPVLDSDGTSFELSFGIRKAKFTLNDSQFRKLQWR